MEPAERRQIGAHYTSERDILKVIGSLFLDDLKAELENAGRNKGKLRKLHQRIESMRLLDPACGCGNFLVISYRELRLLELEIVRRQLKGQRLTDIGTIIKLDVSQMYGIEIEEWPSRIAEVAMWLMDHQMNQMISEEFGEYFVRLPLKSSPHIHHGNALKVAWRDILPPEQCTHVLGNPPFVGKHYATKSQKEDLKAVVPRFDRIGDLDYVCGWYFRACEYLRGTNTSCAFVSTNSISQGELALTFWPELMKRFDVKIHFAHRTFVWKNEARGSAHVHVVIIGFGLFDRNRKVIFDYDGDPVHPTATTVSNISPYLVEGLDADVISKHQTPLCSVPKMKCGNKPSDGGHLVLSPSERAELLDDEPQCNRFIKRFIGSRELINGLDRYCLWLANADPRLLKSCPKVLDRVKRVEAFRERSTAQPTRNAAATPSQFFFVSQPSNRFVAIPEVSSSNRRFIPIALLDPDTIVSNKIYVVPTSSLFVYGVLQSTMHMAWMRQVGGRLKSDYQYSGTIVYNTFPWPENVTDRKQKAVKDAAQAVLDSRKSHRDSTLADLYDPLSMPTDLAKAHDKLDRAVDRCYRAKPFPTERNRFEYLFKLYKKLATPLLRTSDRRAKG
ncbi:MAG: DNA methyltransferase, partial [Planctomycetota bacterium]